MITHEFPDYDVSTLPAIPDEWLDTSWHNDTCPSWQVGPYRVSIDYADPSEREFDNTERFLVSLEQDCLLATNNWQEVLDYVA
jgi:hypothetical protein